MFIDKWDAAHLEFLQQDWDEAPGNETTGVLYESEADKIADRGPRPTSYFFIVLKETTILTSSKKLQYIFHPIAVNFLYEHREKLQAK